MASQAKRNALDLVKEGDVNRKLQIYGILTAFQVGKVPSNEQIDIAINSLLANSALSNPSPDLSAEGRNLIVDLCDVIEQAKFLILSKNEGNLIQNIIWQSKQIQIGSPPRPGAPVDTDTAKQHGKQALDGIRTLGTLIISNGQFRKLLKDTSILLRDIAGDTALKAANLINPSEQELSQLDNPADNNTWHDVPHVSAGKLKQSIMSTYKQNIFSKDDLSDTAANTSEAPDKFRDQTQTASRDRKDERHNGQSDDQIGAAALNEQASNSVLEETKHQPLDLTDYISSKLPQQRREQTTFRIKRLLVECQGHPDYHKAITTLLDLAETYAGHVNTYGTHGTSTVKGALTDDALNRTQADLKILIERFANGTSTKDLFAAINTIYSDADQDPELKNWLKQINAYLRKCLEQQGFIMDNAAPDEWDDLYQKGNFLLRDRYRSHTDRLVDEIKFLIDQFDQDPQNKNFSKALEKLVTDLGNVENGKPKFQPKLLKDLGEVILPALFENIRYLPIPRIEYVDPNVDMVIENLVIDSDNIFPDTFEFTNDNFFRWGRKSSASDVRHSISLHVSGIQMDLKDVSYYLKKKRGFPGITDKGIVNIFLRGTGFSFTIKMATSDSMDQQNFFKVERVDVDIKNFKIKIVQSKHIFLLSIVKPFFMKAIRPAMQKALEKNIKEKAIWLDSMLYQIKLEADRVAEEVKDDPEQTTSVYQRYFSAAQKKLFHGKEKVETAASKTTVNIAVTENDFILPDVNLPGGISSKALKYKELALRGDTWESPVFKLGSASTSQNIPAAPEVARKEHFIESDDAPRNQTVDNDLSNATQNRESSTQGVTDNLNENTTFTSPTNQPYH